MRNRISYALALLAVPAMSAGAQTARWNDRTAERWSDEAPTVRVWFENYSQQLHFGGAARVRFETEDDAYVVVGRVDSDGRMTILFPYSRTERPYVRGGVTNIVRSSRGGSAYSFVTYERWGMGFVFAIASYEPMDLSRFQSRDFGSYDGVMNVMARRYSGNPQRIVEKFAPWVLYDRDTPYDYDILNYSVESPSYASYASYCGGSSYYSDGYGSMDPSFCSHTMGYYSFVCSGLWGYGFSSLCYDPFWGRFYGPRPIIAGVNQPPTTPGTPTPSDKVPNTKLIPQIGAPNDPGTKGGQKALESQTRPTVGGTADDDELNRVYTIPRRALDDLRRQERIERRPISETAVGSGAAGSEPRPVPRDRGGEAEGGRGDEGGRPAAAPGRRDWGRDRDNPTTRADNTPRYEPPPREAPRNIDPPQRGGSGGRFDRGNGGSYSPPPRNIDPGPRTSGGGGGRSSGGGGARDGGTSRPSSPPPARQPASSSTDKKPQHH